MHLAKSLRPLQAPAVWLICTLTLLTACKDAASKPAPTPAAKPAVAPPYPPAAPATPTPAPATPTPDPATAPSTLDGKVATDNAWCPIMTKKAIEPTLPREWTRTLNNQTIGFCCDDCMAYWDSLTPEQQLEKLPGVMRTSTPQAPAPTPSSR